jgi:hypothetical protein
LQEFHRMKIPRLLIIQVHAILACFFLPIALLYFLSGGLYSLDIKGSVDKQVYTLALEQPFTPDLAQLSATVTAALELRELSLPGGDPTIARKKQSYEFRWGDLQRLVVVQPTDDPLQVELVYRQRSPLTQLMRIHRAEAGLLIKILSISMAVSLILVLGSGVFLALGMPKLRRTALLALGAGFIVIFSVFA